MARITLGGQERFQEEYFHEAAVLKMMTGYGAMQVCHSHRPMSHFFEILFPPLSCVNCEDVLYTASESDYHGRS